jgi:hypothetical protein
MVARQDGHCCTSALGGVSSLPIAPLTSPGLAGCFRQRAGWRSSHPVQGRTAQWRLRQQVRAIREDAPHERLVIPRVAQLQADAFDVYDLRACGLAVASQRPERAAMG